MVEEFDCTGAFEEDVWVGFELGQVDVGLAGQWVVGGDECREVVRVEWFVAEVGVARGGEVAGDADVDAVVVEGIELLLGVHFGHGDADVREACAVVADDGGEEWHACGADVADSEVSGLAGCGALHEVAGAFFVGENGDGLAQEGFSGDGDFDLAGVAPEEADSEFGFEVGDLPADGGLHGVEFASGSGEAFGACDGDEGLEQADFHGVDL